MVPIIFSHWRIKCPHSGISLPWCTFFESRVNFSWGLVYRHAIYCRNQFIFIHFFINDARHFLSFCVIYRHECIFVCWKRCNFRTFTSFLCHFYNKPPSTIVIDLQTIRDLKKHCQYDAWTSRNYWKQGVLLWNSPSMLCEYALFSWQASSQTGS